MNLPIFTELTAEEQDWLDAYLDGSITPEAFEKLQDHLQKNPALRQVMRRFLSLDHSLNTLLGADASDEWSTSTSQAPPEKKTLTFPSLLQLGTAASIAFLLGMAVMLWRNGPASTSSTVEAPISGTPPSAEGFAVIRSIFGPPPIGQPQDHQVGDTLGAEAFLLSSGTAEIQFFSGATMTVEGPAEIILKSAWEAECRDGSIRLQVPPAARGFKLQAPATEIIDLGTEFGLSVREGKNHVEVFDGEIALRHRDEDERLLQKGTAFSLPEDGSSSPVDAGELRFPNAGSIQSEEEAHRRSSWERWKLHRNELRKDERLIAYYTFEQASARSLTPNIRLPRSPELDGAIVLAEPVQDRWSQQDSALEFRRPGSRVRVNIPGEFPALTFAAWVRIDSLNRLYTALFMGDGYEDGEPHWQIRDDSRLMLSIMTDESKPSIYPDDTAGLHRVYLSPPIWDPSMSGEWMHLASVYDPAMRRVAHFVDGKLIDEHSIEDKFLVERLRIGNAEIGNWGDPFRKDPHFAIRNLNGRIDDMTIFQSALDDEEIAELHRLSSTATR